MFYDDELADNEYIKNLMVPRNTKTTNYFFIVDLNLLKYNTSKERSGIDRIKETYLPGLNSFFEMVNYIRKLVQNLPNKIRRIIIVR